MAGKSTFLLMGFLAFCIFQKAQQQSPEYQVKSVFNEANRLFNFSEPTEITDTKATGLYNTVIALYQKHSVPPDTFLLYSLMRKGVIDEVYTRYDAAKGAYQHAIRVQALIPAITDSILFYLNLYAGSACYHLNQFDSARFYFDASESLLKRFPAMNEKNRLYNSLAALYYESGNYRQAHNYFLKGLELTNASDRDAIINLKINIGASAIKLGNYQEALDIYHPLAVSGVLTDEIYQNMGKAYKALGNYRESLRYFNRVNPQKVPAVNNEIAYAYIMEGDYEIAEQYLDKVAAGRNNRITASDLGTAELYKAQLLMQQKKLTVALPVVQQSIIHFSSPSFTDTLFESNPTNFSGTFTSYKLYEGLVLKGQICRAIYQQSEDSTVLINSLRAYESAIALVSYITQSYDTDDARFFLKHNTQDAFSGAFEICMLLASLTADRHYIEKAFILTERNKASLLASNVRESKLKKSLGVPPDSLREEQQIKIQIARLNQLADNTTDSLLMDSIASDKRNREIRLSQLLKSYEKIPAYYRVKYEEEAGGIESIQQHLNKKQVLISYTIAGKLLHAFVVKRNSFQHFELGNYESIQILIENLGSELKNVENGHRYKGDDQSITLFHRLITATGIDKDSPEEWIIVPDGSLFYLPFEVLKKDYQSEPLLASKIISYIFSTRFFHQTEPPAIGTMPPILAMAPFTMETADTSGLLPGSAKEIDGLKGLSLKGPDATLDSFLSHMKGFPIIHLATHALAQIDHPASSYIAFYPTQYGSGGKLYQDELYGLDLDSTALLIISACETGQGKLVNAEGVMSLSRGFASAGVKSIVTTLWKANDATTAFIMQRFHQYLAKGEGRAEALRNAKLDYLHSDAMLKSPNYWGHLVLIGDSSPVVTRNRMGIWLPVTAFIVIVVSVYWFRRIKPDRRYSDKK
ncbi:MAG TPA: CHAT domain-containing tetratricopeptide repeat protein [Flavitalea sp.]|nr:CHAT domain-containing tetratricopeptide repeat protein [Flavitalea sp.]